MLLVTPDEIRTLAFRFGCCSDSLLCGCVTALVREGLKKIPDFVHT